MSPVKILTTLFPEDPRVLYNREFLEQLKE
jgi:hypothetical protein